jgi:PhzF family phenazine biosynthesis protein
MQPPAGWVTALPTYTGGMRILIIDAFTEQPFAGNPAAVCLLQGNDWPDEAWMQQIAAEMNLPMTAFAHPLPRSTAADWALRWFTPLIEVNMCGHATLATAHALHSEGLETVTFETRGGTLTARMRDDGSITLNFPAATVTEVPLPDGLAEALGARPDVTCSTGALRDVLAVYADEAAVRAMRPDLPALAGLTRRDGNRGVIITAAADPAQRYDFVSRFFSPANGIPEDAVTGTSHTALGPYWAGRLGRQDLTGLQVSARSGVVRTGVDGDRVNLTGHAVTILDGILRPIGNSALSAPPVMAGPTIG